MSKTCSGCKETKPLEEFYRRKGRPNGVSRCKACYKLLATTQSVKLSKGKWKESNREKVREISSRWHKKNPEVVKQIRRKSYELNLEHQKSSARAWRVVTES